MGNETLPATIQEAQLPATAEQIGKMFVQHSAEEMKEIAGDAMSFLPRLQLMTANSDDCKSGAFPINNFALVTGVSAAKELKNLGKTVDVFIITWRSMALSTGDNPMAVYVYNDPEFIRIKGLAESNDQTIKMNNNYGPQYLLWVPAIKQFATLFMGSKSARIASAGVTARIGHSATLSSMLVKKPEFSWWVIKTDDGPDEMDMPTMEQIAEEAHRFNNPPVRVKAEKAPEGTEQER